MPGSLTLTFLVSLDRAYTTRMLSPADVSAVGAGTHAEYHLFEYHGSVRDPTAGEVKSVLDTLTLCWLSHSLTRHFTRTTGAAQWPGAV